MCGFIAFEAFLHRFKKSLSGGQRYPAFVATTSPRVAEINAKRSLE